ncbi:uncharacterized protein LOC111268663 isoform X2 [Varroa jacobsoni]|uniref:uncharacterized protein LOC111268663 isoform X2 n=1 Tax=Varroa jacobsoni TaxID=62625 RepID=UPI000BF7638B|nr:uncharacterized protein LOC111268663 isoform X2 [Varroa jacobsoni]
MRRSEGFSREKDGQTCGSRPRNVECPVSWGFKPYLSVPLENEAVPVAQMAVDTGEESIEHWASGPSAQSLSLVSGLSKSDLQHFLGTSLNGNLSLSQGQLIPQAHSRNTAHNEPRRHQEDCNQNDQPQDLSINRTQSQPELRLRPEEAQGSGHAPSVISRPLSKMEQKQMQWERERLELQAMQSWGPPSMVDSARNAGRRLQPVAAVSPQRASFSSPYDNSSYNRKATNILNMEYANHVQLTDRQNSEAGGNRFSVANEAKKRLGSFASDVADPEVLRIERVQKAAEYRKAIEQQVEEKRRRKIAEELRSKREDEAAERKLQEERERLRKQYEEEQRKIRLKEEAEERTRQILLEKVKEAEAAAEQARRMRLRRNHDTGVVGQNPDEVESSHHGRVEPQDELIAASVQNILKLPSAPSMAQANSNSSPSQTAPEPVLRQQSDFLAASSNLPSATKPNGINAMARSTGDGHAMEFPTQQPQLLQALMPLNNSETEKGFPLVQSMPGYVPQHSSMAPVTTQAPLVIQAAPFSSAPTPMRATYSTSFVDQAGEIYNGTLLHHQMPLVHKCQTYIESMASPPRTSYSSCSCSCQLPRLAPYLKSFSTQTPPGYVEDRVLTPTKFRLRQRSQSLKSLRNSAVQTEWTISRNMSPPSSAPSSPITGRPSRRRKGHTSTGGLDRGDKSGTQSRPPWNVHTPQHAYIKNTDRDPNMHTRKKLQHWEREMNQQSAWQQSTRRKITAQEKGNNTAALTSRRLTPTKKRERASSLHGTDRYSSDSDFSIIANNETATGSDFPDQLGYNTDRAIGKGLRDDGVDSSEVSATASATPGPAPTQPDQATCPKRSSPPAPAPRKTWKSQSMFIPQGRAESPPVPAVLSKLRQQRRSSDDLNSTRDESIARGFGCAEGNENDFIEDTSTLSISHASHQSRASNGLTHSIGLSTSHGSLTGYRSQVEEQTKASCGTPLDTTFESAIGGQAACMNDQKRILSQLSALRQNFSDIANETARAGELDINPTNDTQGQNVTR